MITILFSSAPISERRLVRVAAVFFAFLLCASSLAFGEEPLLALYNERPPYLVPGADGNVTGLTANPAAYALRKAKIPFKWVDMPSARQMLMLQENSSKVVAVGWFKNPEREKFTKFSNPIYQDKQIVVLARKDNLKIAAIAARNTTPFQPQLAGAGCAAGCLRSAAVA